MFDGGYRPKAVVLQLEHILSVIERQRPRLERHRLEQQGHRLFRIAPEDVNGGV